MNRIVRSSLAALALFAFSLVGCEAKPIWLQITGLDEGEVEGVWLWRFSDELGDFVRACRLSFGEPGDPGEPFMYNQECGDAAAGFGMRGDLRRSVENPAVVTIGLWYFRWENAGAYKISSYGIYGETGLSGTTIQL